MKIYKEVLIESAEQAEALHEGTVATRDGHLPRLSVIDAQGHHWVTGTRPGNVHPVDMIGWTALIPVEAEVEQRTVLAGSNAPFTGLYGSLDDDRLRDKEGNDITESYKRWVQTLPAQTRIVSEWQ